MHDNRLDARRPHSQELSHVHTKLTVCVCVCVDACASVRACMCVCAWLCLCMQASESVKHRGRERERVRKSLFSDPGSVDVVELFMCFCDAILAALGHRGNNKRFLNSTTRAGNDGFRNTPWPIVRSLVPR